MHKIEVYEKQQKHNQSLIKVHENQKEHEQQYYKKLKTINKKYKESISRLERHREELKHDLKLRSEKWLLRKMDQEERHDWIEFMKALKLKNILHKHQWL